MRNARRIGVIIPALNEERAIAQVISEIPSWVDQIIVGDSGLNLIDLLKVLAYRIGVGNQEIMLLATIILLSNSTSHLISTRDLSASHAKERKRPAYSRCLAVLSCTGLVDLGCAAVLLSNTA